MTPTSMRRMSRLGLIQKRFPVLIFPFIIVGFVVLAGLNEVEVHPVRSVHHGQSAVCFLMISPSNLELARIGRDHWGRKVCSTFLLFAGNATKFDEDTSDVIRLNLERDDDRGILSHKAYFAYQYVYEHFPQADWVIKADPDTYVLAENLINYLHRFNTMEPFYLGRVFKIDGDPRDTFVAGALVAVSRGAMIHLGRAMVGDNEDIQGRLTNHAKVDENCRLSGWDTHSHADDVALSVCLRQLGIFPHNTRDSLNRERFSVFNVDTVGRDEVVNQTSGWYGVLSFNNRLGRFAASPETVCFHYMDDKHQYERELVFQQDVWKWKQGMK